MSDYLQNSYPYAPEPTFDGQWEHKEGTQPDTYFVPPSTTVEFGRVVGLVTGATSQFITHAAAASVRFLGVARADAAREARYAEGDARYQAGDSVPVQVTGRIAVRVVDALTVADDGAVVNVVVTVGANQGKVSKASAGGVLAGAKFLVRAPVSAGGLVIVDLG